jgi:hypothetical protein
MNNREGSIPTGESSPRTPEAAKSEAAAASRRRFVRGATAVPVVLAVSGRSALATGGGDGCSTVKGLSPMAWMSYHPQGDVAVRCPSHTVNPNTLGKSPGYWKPNLGGKTFQGPWPSAVAPFTTVKKQNGTSVSWVANNWNYYDKLVDGAGWAAGTPASMLGDSRSFSRILMDDNGTLIWHLCAAYLNALMNEQSGGPANGYALTSTEVIALANKTLMGNVTTSNLKDFLNQTWA